MPVSLFQLYRGRPLKPYDIICSYVAGLLVMTCR